MVSEILYNILIMPIELLVSFMYELMKGIFGNAEIAIIAVSIIMQTLLFVFHKNMNENQNQRDLRRKPLEKWLQKGWNHFNGAEQKSMLIKCKNWNITVLKSFDWVAILCQISFFVASYHFFSASIRYSKRSFWFLNDLGMQDRLLHIGAVTINLLPLVAILINIILAIVYTGDKSLKKRIQLFGVNVVFISLLYNSASGLVLYWLVGSFYSLLKNIMFRNKGKSCGLKRKKKSDIGKEEYKKGSVAYYINRSNATDSDYYWIAALCTLFFGAIIPLNIFFSSPMEFVTSEFGPAYLVCNSLSVFAGAFFLWGRFAYRCMDKMCRAIFLVILVGLFSMAIVNYVFWGDSKGEVSALLISADYGSNQKEIVMNLYVCYVVFFVAFLAYMVLKKYVDIVIRVVVLSFGALAIMNSISIASELYGLDKSTLETEIDITPIIPVSKNGNNIMVIMLDRAISGYLPYIFKENTDIAEAYDGFVYYPNTISFGGFTNYGAPPLFGGYEYTPDEMNKRDDTMLVDKHNESLKMMPMLFGKEGYEVTVCDPPYANYTWIPDLKIYNNVPNTTAYITEGRYLKQNLEDKETAAIEYKSVLRHNTIYYPIVKTIPLIVQSFLCPSSGSLIQDVSVDNTAFAQCYSVLQNLKGLTRIEENGDTLLLFQNATTHEPITLDLPDYSTISNSMGFEQRRMLQPKIEINGVRIKFDNEDQMAHYHVNMVALAELAKWFDYLRDEDVYDNTRIIIVSDHGRDLKQFDDMKINEDIDLQSYSSLLMVKDFGATGFETSDDFMTIADVVTYATENVIDNPVNPFTGKAINNDEKYAHPQLITTSDKFMVNDRRYTFDTSGSNWYSVHDNIFDASNWKQVEYQQKER